MRYSGTLIDHLRQPRNAGAFEPGTAGVLEGRAGEAEGDCLQLQLRVDASGIIEESRFLARGCAATIALGSLATEKLAGLSLAQARELSTDALAETLSLPPLRRYCLILVDEAVRAALEGAGDHLRETS